MEDMELKLSEDNIPHVDLIENASDIRDGEPFPIAYYEPLKALWNDPNICKAYQRGNEAALPDKCVRCLAYTPIIRSPGFPLSLAYFYGALDRLFEPDYQPDMQDIVHTRARTIGITETTFQLGDSEMLMVDVGGQKSERRKWIHCFQDVTSILFLVSLSGYDQCLVEDKDAVSAFCHSCGSTMIRHPLPSESNARRNDNMGFDLPFPVVQTNINCRHYFPGGRELDCFMFSADSLPQQERSV